MNRISPKPKTLAALIAARMRLEQSGSGEPVIAALGRSLKRLEVRLSRPVRITLLGEFNAGKSSLANLLIGRAMLPTDILSSTRAPTLIRPAGGKGKVSSIGLDGRLQKFTMEDVERLSRERAQILEVGLPGQRLREFEILDTPGISDPTNEYAFADATSVPANIALWCTLATQAWRESERWAWESLPRRMRAASLMIITHKDSLLGPNDGEKVLNRVRHEAGKLFKNFVLISLTDAARARNEDRKIVDPALWRASGGEELATKLSDLVATVSEHRLASAEMVVRCLAKRALHDAETRTLPDDRPQLIAAWMDLTAALAARLTPETGDVPALVNTVLEDVTGFVSEKLAPWLEMRFEAEEANQVLSLLPTDHAALSGVVDGLAPAPAAKFLRQVVEQAQVELPQALMGMELKPRPRPVPANVRAILNELAAFPPKVIPENIPTPGLEDPTDDDELS